MFGGLVGLVILIVAIAAVALWVERSREAQAAPETTRKPPRNQPATPRRVSLLTEAVGYIGAILVLAGAISAIGDAWSDLSTWTRLVILAIGTFAFLAVGLVTRLSDEPAFRRLSAISWALSVAGFAGGVGVINQFYDTEPETAFLSISVASTVYAAGLWWVNKHAVQQAVTFAGVLLTASAIVTRAVENPKAWMVCVPLWVIAIAWTVFGWLRRIPPWWTAVPLGIIVALIAPANIEPAAAKYSIGLATAVAIMGAGVYLKFTPGLGLGAIGLFGYVVGAVVYYFRDTLGAPAALAIAGLLILAIAAAAARLLPFYRRKPPSQLPPAEAPPSERHAA